MVAPPLLAPKNISISTLKLRLPVCDLIGVALCFREWVLCGMKPKLLHHDDQCNSYVPAS